MASATLCFTGFARDELTAILAQFEQANAALGHRWSLVPEADARVLVIDMDSMYGHMTWLKAHGSGRTTVGLTASDRSETDHLLRRPLATVALESLLRQLDVSPSPSAVAGSVVAPAPPLAPIAPASQAPAFSDPVAAAVRNPQPSPVETPASEAEPESRSNPSADYIAAVTTGQMAAMGPVIAHEPRISDFLPAGRLGGPATLQVPGGPLLAFDPGSQTYAGSATLKPLLAFVDSNIEASSFNAVGQDEFERIKVANGGAQPYMRLLWLCGLTAGKGHLLPGFSPGRKVVLTKWPQIEREYPKHFRIATVMMKGPALSREIAEATGVAESEVIDFINAGLIAGSVVVEGSPAAGGDVARASAMLAKPRNS